MAGGAPVLHIAQQPEADELLARDPFALLTGMLLDQQFPMERAFAGPHVIAERMGVDRLDPAVVAAGDPDEFAGLLRRPPAVHRYPGAMAARIQALAAHVAESYGGSAERVWSEAADGAELLARLRRLPGFGEQKAKIFTALLGKQLGVRPPGWREVAGGYGEDGVYRSVADVTGQESLERVRATKREAKRRADR